MTMGQATSPAVPASRREHVLWSHPSAFPRQRGLGRHSRAAGRRTFLSHPKWCLRSRMQNPFVRVLIPCNKISLTSCRGGLWTPDRLSPLSYSNTLGGATHPATQLALRSTCGYVAVTPALGDTTAPTCVSDPLEAHC